mmetsp:Transcript_34577/g.108376  ORF Transcript_34577/g.108376 Transcript_34577/m.108376 type:complete len:310 (-) Transcript_34577:2017-2946(-)
MSADIGLVIKWIPDKKVYRIIGFHTNGSAKQTGMLNINDTLLEVNKESVSGLAQKDVEAKLRGEPGSKVRLKVSRGDDSFHCTIGRTDLHSFVVKKTKEAPVKEPEPKKKKLTDREKADKLLNQGTGKYSGASFGSALEKVSDREASRIRGQTQKEHERVQAEADRLYEETVKKDREEQDKNVHDSVNRFCDQCGAPRQEKKAPVEKQAPVQEGKENHFALGDCMRPRKAEEPAKKVEEKPWWSWSSDSSKSNAKSASGGGWFTKKDEKPQKSRFKDRLNQAKFSFAMSIIDYRIRKTNEEFMAVITGV